MNTTRDTIRLYWHHVKKYPALASGLLIGTPITSFVHNFVPPLILANVIDRLSKGDYTKGDLWGSFGHDLVWYTILSIIGTVVLWRIIVIFVWTLENKVLRDINERIFSHLLRQSASFHANHFGGSLVSQTTKLSGAYIRLADTAVFQIIPLISAFVFTIVILLPRAPMFIGILLIFSVAYMISAVLITKKIRGLNAREATASSKQTGYLSDSITNVMAIKSFSGSTYEEKRYHEAAENTLERGMELMRHATRRDIYFSSVTTSVGVLALVMATAGVVLFDADMATVFLILNYTGIIIRQLWEFSGATLRAYNRAMGDAKDMMEILSQEPEVLDPASPEPVRITAGAISFDKVIFSHDGADDALFENLNLHIKPGEKIGLVGHSGSGKTTLTRILLRFSDIDGGSITIDGQNIAAITQDDLRRSIAYVPQEPLLFHRSIRENIAYGKPDATDEEIRAAAQKANAADFIEKLPDGYGTMVGERGVKLSGGQRQRIAIARAILKNAPILVLDEATSALDSESELLIQAALNQLMEQRTAIVIAHRLSTIQKMDRILVLEKGTIVEQGSHAELVNKKGVYAQLWAHQSGGFIED